MNNRLINKMFFNTTVVQFFSMLIMELGVFVDGAIIGGCLGSEAMASYGFALPIATVISGVSTFFFAGISALCGRAVARGDTKTSNRIFSQCILVSMITSVSLLLICFGNADRLAVLSGARNGLERETADYIRGYALCVPALLLSRALTPILQIDGDRSRVIRAVSIMTGINVILDVLVGVVLHKGLLFMALCTAISYCVGAIILLLHFRKKDTMFRFSLSEAQPKLQTVMSLFSYGLPDALQQFCRSALNFCMNHILLITGGANAVSAFSAIYSASLICIMLGSSIGDSIYVMNSLFVGEKDAQSIREMLRTAMKTAFVLNAALSIIMFMISPVFMRLFLHSNQEALQFAITGFRIYSMSIILYSFNVIWRTYYQSMHLLNIAYPYVILNNFGFIALSAFVLSRFWGIHGVWFSFLTGQALSLLFIILWNLTRAENKDLLEAMMRLPEDFSSGVLSLWAWSCRSPDEIVKISTEVGRICKAEGASSRIALILQLVVEEMGNNILQYGFTDNKAHSIDIKMQHLKDGWLLRFRDDCVPFDPTKYVSLFECSSPEEHIGIRAVKSLARKMEYVNTMQFNNLLIEVGE